MPVNRMFQVSYITQKQCSVTEIIQSIQVRGEFPYDFCTVWNEWSFWSFIADKQ